MKTDSIKLEICPNCGSTGHIQDYPVKGQRICVKCGQENVEIDLKVIRTQEDWLDNCPFCGKEGEEDDTLFENDDITVFKCKKCGKLDGYRSLDSSIGLEYNDESYDTLAVKIAEQEGSYVHSASKLQKYRKTLEKKEKMYAPIKKCRKQANSLINIKNREMNDIGMSPETIKIVRDGVHRFLEKEGPVTKKQLNSILAAGLSLIQKSDQIYYRKTLGKKVTDQQLEKIFGVTRKTIRKWRRILHEKSFF